MDELPKRKQLRLKEYDYSQHGYYYITICTYNKQNFFGKIIDGNMNLNAIGKIVDFSWNDLICHNDVNLYEYIVMPNHLHGIIEIRCCQEQCNPMQQSKGIPEIIRQFKTFSSKRINKYLKFKGCKPFSSGELWQKSYYEHIIRNENDYKEIAEYIMNNPLRYELKK